MGHAIGGGVCVEGFRFEFGFGKEREIIYFELV